MLPDRVLITSPSSGVKPIVVVTLWPSSAAHNDCPPPRCATTTRRAAGAIENAANTVADKNPDELIEDTRNFVRNSPGVALAGAAVVGFVVARLIKSGLGSAEEDDEEA